MPFIELGNDAPGILGLLAYRPATAQPLMALAETLLRSDNSLSRGERELIAAYVSRLNRCEFCDRSHSAFAAKQLDDGPRIVAQVMQDLQTASIGDKLKALLHLAQAVQEKRTTSDEIERCRAAGATDTEIHDTVLIAAAFCMYNRYVDGLGASWEFEASAYSEMADVVVALGYARSDGADS
jgi:uncharacterized peroxidase-related enzyme